MGQITGKILTPDLMPAAHCELLFRPASTLPGVRPTDAITVDEIRRQTNSLGILAATELSLAAGDYFLWIGVGSRPKRITVLDLGFPQLLQDLLGGGPGSASAGSNFQVVGNQLQLLSDGGSQLGFVAKGVWPDLQLALVSGSSEINFRHRGGMLEILNADDQEWYAPVYMGDRATPTLTWLNHGADPITNQRIKSGRLQLQNVDEEVFYSVLLYGSGLDGFQLGFGQPEV